VVAGRRSTGPPSFVVKSSDVDRIDAKMVGQAIAPKLQPEAPLMNPPVMLAGDGEDAELDVI
jgi:hypothetical protein